jgi:hypothetical protein
MGSFPAKHFAACRGAFENALISFSANTYFEKRSEKSHV